MILYIAGKYSGDVTDNIAKAREVAIKVWESGNVALCPHLNTAHFEDDCKCTYDQFLNGVIALMRRCDGVVMIPGWEESKGALQEHALAVSLNMPIFYAPHIPDGIHPTEKKSPNQCTAFIDIVMNMYRVHLRKNMDYGPGNILMTGDVGLATRLWDKIGRLLNLIGFRFTVTFEKFDSPKAPQNESIEDNVMDAAVYAIIWQIFRKGMWGR